MFNGPLFHKKTIILVKDLTECRSHIQYASFDTCKAKIGSLFIPESVFEVPWEIDFRAIYSWQHSNESKVFITAFYSCLIKYFWKTSDEDL